MELEINENSGCTEHKKRQNAGKYYVLAFKSMAFTSMMFGFALVSVCLWVLISLSEEQVYGTGADDKPEASQFRILTILVNQPARSDIDHDHNDNNQAQLNTTDDDVDVRQVQEKFAKAWTTVGPYFQGSCGLALCLALTQVISSMIILTSSSKGTLRWIRAFLWKCVHFCLCVLLLLCLVVPLSIDKSSEDGGIRQHLEDISHALKRHNSSTHTLNSEHVNNMTLLYGTLVVDVALVSILIVLSHFILRVL